MLDFKSFFAIAGLDDSELDIDPNVIETKSTLTICAKQIIDNKRVCPKCGSASSIIHGHYTSLVENSVSRVYLKRIVVNVERTRLICKNCGATYTPDLNLVKRYGNVSRNVERHIYFKTMEPVSFSLIARELNITVTTVRKIFNDIVRIGRSALSTAICIDEKHFVSDYGKYILVISNPFSGKILDIVATRKTDVMNDYFLHIPQKERENVRFFISDMYEPYKKLRERFFPKAIHIIDHFHITRQFTNVIQILRKDCMKQNDKRTPEYAFLKKHRKLFLINPFANETTALDKEVKIANRSMYYTYRDMIKNVLREYPQLAEIHSIYYDYCKYLQIGMDDDELSANLEFIINRCLNSSIGYIRTIGDTLLKFRKEILNYFSSANSFKLSNATAESVNNKIQKIIDCSYGMKDFKTLRKRILHANKK